VAAARGRLSPQDPGRLFLGATGLAGRGVFAAFGALVLAAGRASGGAGFAAAHSGRRGRAGGQSRNGSQGEKRENRFHSGRLVSEFDFEMKAQASLQSWHGRTWQIRRRSSPIMLPFDGMFAASSRDDASLPSTKQGAMLQVPSGWARIPLGHIKSKVPLPRRAVGHHSARQCFRQAGK